MLANSCVTREHRLRLSVMQNTQGEIYNLLDALRLRLNAIQEARDGLLPHWPTGAKSAFSGDTPIELPACSYLGSALAAALSGPEAAIARSLGALKDRLRWTYSYPARDGFEDLATRIAFCQVVGNKGLISSRNILVGFTLLAPHTHYPAHRHPASEFYIVLSGTALWQQDTEPAEPRPPGAIIFHRSGVTHAMESGDEALLAAFTWHGDVETPSTYDD